MNRAEYSGTKRTYTEPPNERYQAGALKICRDKFDCHLTGKAMASQIMDAFCDLHQIKRLPVLTVALPLVSIPLGIFALFVPDPEVVAAVTRALLLRHAILVRCGKVGDRPCDNITTPFPAEPKLVLNRNRRSEGILTSIYPYRNRSSR